MKFSEFAKKQVEKEPLKSEENIESSYEKLQGMSQDQLMNELFSTVKEQKGNGSFDFNALKSGVESMKGYMDEQTYENINNLLKGLK